MPALRLTQTTPDGHELTAPVTDNDGQWWTYCAGCERFFPSTRQYTEVGWYFSPIVCPILDADLDKEAAIAHIREQYAHVVNRIEREHLEARIALGLTLSVSVKAKMVKALLPPDVECAEAEISHE